MVANEHNLRASVPATMRAAAHRAYGSPDVLSVETIATPVPGADDVLVRVHAANVSIGDHHVITGKPYLVRLSPYGGLPHPRNLVPGGAMAGVVAAVGANVTAFRPGDEVFGQAEHGAFAEYLALPASRVARKPANLTFEEAAAAPWGTTALQGLRDPGGVGPGQRVLLIGASGAVGTWAVQIAKALGARVTAVCSTANVDRVRALGADEVVDYTRTDVVAAGSRFDVVMDMVGTLPLGDCKRLLVDGGRYVACAVGDGDILGPLLRIVGGLIRFAFSGRRFVTFVQKLDAKDLDALRELVEARKATPVIEHRFLLADVARALDHVGKGHGKGQTVLRIAT